MPALGAPLGAAERAIDPEIRLAQLQVTVK
jgi:hypothetical protein